MWVYLVSRGVVKAIVNGMLAEVTFCKGFFNGFDVSFDESV